MKVYVVLHIDRHADPEITVFADKDKAIDYARKRGNEFDRFDDYEEKQIPGWLFYCSYSCGGDGIRVEEKEIK